ncbi:MAG TPA: hypothetical protein VGR73_00710 [Bryobacteraceae bacterium]|nr:hypothetical protein [Bryobacteraceae bacterium]
MDTRRWKSAGLAIVLAIPLLGQSAKDSASVRDLSAGDFFIISSVDLGKRQILLKRPTEVTELMRVGEDTRYFDEQGKSIRLADLRAGDTVYIGSKQSGEQSVAVTIRKGAMTLDVLRERYLKGKK